jgi:hypothetical protein
MTIMKTLFVFVSLLSSCSFEAQELRGCKKFPLVIEKKFVRGTLEVPS